MKLIILYLLLIISGFQATCQSTFDANTDQDSLKKILPSLKGDKRADALLSLGESYKNTNTPNAIIFFKTALPLAHNKKGTLRKIHDELGVCYTIAAQYDSAFYHFQKAINLSNGQDTTLAKILSHKAMMYSKREQYTDALKLCFQVLDINDHAKNKLGIVNAYINIAGLYARLGNNKDAAHYDSLAYQITKDIGDVQTGHTILGNLGVVLKDLGEYEAAKATLKQVIIHHEKFNPGAIRLANVYYNTAQLYVNFGELDSSYQYAQKALVIFKKTNALYELAVTCILLADIELAVGKLKQSEEHGLLAYSFYNQLPQEDYRRLTTLNMMKISLWKRDIDNALYYETKFHIISDSAEDSRQGKAVAEMQTQYETQKKIRENDLLKKEASIQTIALEKSNYRLLSSALGILLLATVILLLYVQSKNRKRLNKTLILENEMLRIEKLTAQLNHLRAQVSPHFLFNSLSTLQGMVNDNDLRSGKFIESLSEVYRYILETDATDLVSVEQELGIANAYIFLLRTRFNDSLNITVNLPDRILPRKLPPFSLQLLIENAIKHNMATLSRPLQIDLYADDQKFCVRNNLQPKRSVVESTRIGLSNLQKRFSLLGHYEMNIRSTEHHFCVELPLI